MVYSPTDNAHAAVALAVEIAELAAAEDVGSVAQVDNCRRSA